MKMIGIAFLGPFLPLLRETPRGTVEFAFSFQIAFQVCDMRMIAAIALHLVQDLEKHRKDGITA